MYELAMPALWGVFIGVVNHLLIRGPLREMARLQAEQPPVDQEAAQRTTRRLYGRFGLRLVVSLVGIAVAFFWWRATEALLAALVGLLLMNLGSLWQNQRYRRQRS